MASVLLWVALGLVGACAGDLGRCATVDEASLLLRTAALELGSLADLPPLALGPKDVAALLPSLRAKARAASRAAAASSSSPGAE